MRTVGRAERAVYTAKDGNVELTGTPRVQSGLNTHVATSPETVMIYQSKRTTHDARAEPNGNSPGSQDRRRRRNHEWRDSDRNAPRAGSLSSRSAGAGRDCSGHGRARENLTAAAPW